MSLHPDLACTRALSLLSLGTAVAAGLFWRVAVSVTSVRLHLCLEHGGCSGNVNDSLTPSLPLLSSLLIIPCFSIVIPANHMSAGVLPGHLCLPSPTSDAQAGHFPHQGFPFLILQMSAELWPPLGNVQIPRSLCSETHLPALTL